MRATKYNAHEFIARQVDFKTSGSFSGLVVHDGLYIVYSYAEPIAAWISGTGWLVTHTKFSATTSQHTSKARLGAGTYTQVDSVVLKAAIRVARELAA